MPIVQATAQESTVSWRPCTGSVSSRLERTTTVDTVTADRSVRPSFTRVTARVTAPPGTSPENSSGTSTDSAAPPRVSDTFP